ncbi:MAG: hypothetical protein MUE54_04185 [Anaerolineae bacterium]|jgi:hypothetical protein|nr:hypothetical protein [Anaerolineae bacterium]
MTRQKWMTLFVVLCMTLLIATTPVFGAEEPVAETPTTAEEAVDYGPGTTLIFLLMGITGVTVVGAFNWFTEMSERKEKKSSS